MVVDRGHAAASAVIPEPDDQKGHRKRRGSRGGRPIELDAADYRNRHVIERHYCHIRQRQGLATRYDKLAITYRAAVVLNAVITWTRQLSDALGPSESFPPGLRYGCLKRCPSTSQRT